MIMAPDNSNFRRFRRRKLKVALMTRRGLDTLESRYGRTLRAAVDVVFMRKIRELFDYYEGGFGSVDSALNMADALQWEAAEQLRGIAMRSVPDWFSAVDKYAVGKFTRSIKDAMGIDAVSILQQDIYDRVRDETITSNVGLIRGLFDESFLDVKRAILADYQGLGLGTANSLSGRIQEIIGSTKDRASVIARDQTAKLNGQLAQARQEDAGITHYVWRTAGDNRVVGNKDGLYPVGNAKHMNHYERDGVVYAWNNPPEDGHPGEAIQCRCIALAIIDPMKIEIYNGKQ